MIRKPDIWARINEFDLYMDRMLHNKTGKEEIEAIHHLVEDLHDEVDQYFSNRQELGLIIHERILRRNR